MRLVVDQPLSWEVAAALRSAGHDALHVRDVGLSAASDDVILQFAKSESRVIVTQALTSGPCWRHPARHTRPS